MLQKAIVDTTPSNLIRINKLESFILVQPLNLDNVFIFSVHIIAGDADNHVNILKEDFY